VEVSPSRAIPRFPRLSFAVAQLACVSLLEMVLTEPGCRMIGRPAREEAGVNLYIGVLRRMEGRTKLVEHVQLSALCGEGPRPQAR
jgi:hypothetical protein